MKKYTIEGKDITLKFGFKFLRIFGEMYSLEGYTEVIEFLSKHLSDFSKITFKQEDMMRNVLIAAAQNAESKNQDHLQNVDVMSYMIDADSDFAKIMEALGASFPKAEGKPQPRKKARSKQK